MKVTAKDLVLSALFIASGIVLPLAFHMFGGAGPIFLPIHIPVLIAGFMVSWPLAILVGTLTPLLSSLLTGMPPLFPMLPIMIFELATYSLVVNVVSGKAFTPARRFSDVKIKPKFDAIRTYLALIIAMVFGRLASALVVFILTSLFTVKLPSPLVFIQGGLITGLPGILIQLVFVPGLVFAVFKYNNKG